MHLYKSSLNETHVKWLIKCYKIPEELHPQVVPEEMTMDELPNDFIGLATGFPSRVGLEKVPSVCRWSFPFLEACLSILKDLKGKVLMMAEFLQLPNFRGCKDMKVAEMSCKTVLAEKEKKKRKAEAKAAAKADDSDQVEKVVGKKRAGEEGTSRRKKRKMRQETPPINLDSKHVSSPIPLNHFKPLETLANEAHVSENAYAGRLDALRN
ncbi:hypothetical protein Tco_0341658 [Tanacetum coccineum]